MPKFKLNRIFEKMSGTFGDIVLYEADGQQLSRGLPTITSERTDRQVANSGRFGAAGRYASAATADPVVKAAYKAICTGHQNARNMAIRDYQRPPVIHGVDLSGYTGKPGDALRITATDDFEVARVQVAIRDPDGNLLEEGAAELVNRALGEWVYRVSVEVAAGQTVSVTVTAQDRPGNKVEAQRWHHL